MSWLEETLHSSLSQLNKCLWRDRINLERWRLTSEIWELVFFNNKYYEVNEVYREENKLSRCVQSSPIHGRGDCVTGCTVCATGSRTNCAFFETNCMDPVSL